MEKGPQLKMLMTVLGRPFSIRRFPVKKKPSMPETTREKGGTKRKRPGLAGHIVFIETFQNMGRCQAALQPIGRGSKSSTTDKYK